MGWEIIICSWYVNMIAKVRLQDCELFWKLDTRKHNWRAYDVNRGKKFTVYGKGKKENVWIFTEVWDWRYEINFRQPKTERKYQPSRFSCLSKLPSPSVSTSIRPSGLFVSRCCSLERQYLGESEPFLFTVSGFLICVRMCVADMTGLRRVKRAQRSWGKWTKVEKFKNTFRFLLLPVGNISVKSLREINPPIILNIHFQTSSGFELKPDVFHEIFHSFEKVNNESFHN